MSQTTGEEMLNRINATLGVLQDAQEKAVEAVRDVATHKADPDAHGEIIAAAVEAAVNEALGGTSGGGGSAGEDGEQLADRLSALENRFDGSGMLLAQHLPLTDAVDSDTGQLAASDTAVKTLHDRLSALSGEGIPADSRMWIGVPRYWRSTTLPANHCWANGDFVAFADWPELEQVYNSGGFAGMLLDWDADGPTQAANLGRWRPDAAEPTGLFTPNLVGQYLRGWGQNAPQTAGCWQDHAMQQWYGIYYRSTDKRLLQVVPYSGASGSGGIGAVNALSGSAIYYTQPYTSITGATLANMADETRPVTVWQPLIIYLGQPAAA